MSIIISCRHFIRNSRHHHLVAKDIIILLLFVVYCTATIQLSYAYLVPSVSAAKAPRGISSTSTSHKGYFFSNYISKKKSSKSSPYFSPDLRGGGGWGRKHPALKGAATSSSSSSDSDSSQRSIDDINDYDFIKSSLKHGIPFKDLTDDDFHRLVSSFEKVEYTNGTTIFTQGDIGDEMIIIDEGVCTVSIDGRTIPDPYGTMTKGSVVGELALLYDSGRAATVVATTHVSAFKLHRDAFINHFLNNLPNRQEQIDDIKTQIRNIDTIIDKISGVKARYQGDIIRQYKPHKLWLWKRWGGTIFEHAWKTAAMNMIVSICFSAFVRRIMIKDPTWSVGMIPDTNNPIIARFVGLTKLWKYQMNVTTFILTFFLSQAYAVWKDMYSIGRRIQGRMNDINLILASSALRNKKTGRYTDQAQTLLDDVGSYCRLFHVFMWSSYTKSFNLLLSDIGMRRMISRGMITRKQYDTLLSLNPNTGPYCNACLMWILIRCLQGMDDGNDKSLPNDFVLREQLYIKIQELRSTFATIPDLLAGRIPLAYAHFVQVLVDAFVFLAPFALYSELGIWSTPAVGLLTIFYSGFLDLSKILLDPLDNDEFYQESVNMDVGVLIRESNAGSNRWKLGAEVLPF